MPLDSLYGRLARGITPRRFSAFRSGNSMPTQPPPSGDLITPTFLNAPNIYNSDTAWANAPLDTAPSDGDLATYWGTIRDGLSVNERPRLSWTMFSGRKCWRQKIEENTTGVDEGSSQMIMQFSPVQEAYCVTMLYFPQYFLSPVEQKMAGGLGGGPDVVTNNQPTAGHGFNYRFDISAAAGHSDQIFPNNRYFTHLARDAGNATVSTQLNIEMDLITPRTQAINGVVLLLQQRVKTNTIGVANGIVETWFGAETYPGANDWLDPANPRRFRKASSVTNRETRISGGTNPGIEYYFHSAHIGGTGTYFRMGPNLSGLEYYFLTCGVYIGTQPLLQGVA